MEKFTKIKNVVVLPKWPTLKEEIEYTVKKEITVKIVTENIDFVTSELHGCDDLVNNITDILEKRLAKFTVDFINENIIQNKINYDNIADQLYSAKEILKKYNI